MYILVDYMILSAKKLKQIGKKGKGSSFESELTNVGRKSVKGLRYRLARRFKAEANFLYFQNFSNQYSSYSIFN